MEFGAGTFVIVFFVVVAILGPFFGADSRDGRDWHRTGPPPERKRAPGRVRERMRRQVALWDTYLTANQPWREHGPMRWRDDGGTWVLDGDTPPELPKDDLAPGDVTPRDVTPGDLAPRDDTPDDDAGGLRIGPHRDGS